MKTIIYRNRFLMLAWVLFVFNVFGLAAAGSYTGYKGIVVDKNSGKPLAHASIVLSGSSISTVTNSDGEFSLKIPDELNHSILTVTFIGYSSKKMPVSDLQTERNTIQLEPKPIQLPEVSIISKDAAAIVKAMFEKIPANYPADEMLMTAFYRESIKKNRSYVSLSEAVVEVDKQSYASARSDLARLYKSRKKTDYNRLDTLTFKLMGGPFNTIYLDVIKNPEYVFTDDMFMNYDFIFDHSTHIDDRLIYIIDFKQKPTNQDPLYFGKLYVDAESMALKSAVFSLNLSNKEESSKMFIIKKPFNATITPFEASYRIDYEQKDGKWYYSYGRIQLAMKINWKRKLFNTNYFSAIEMAATDWDPVTESRPIKSKDRLKPSVIIADEALGFGDPDFWGEYNVIEPEKPIESAIKKIQKQLEKSDKE